MSLNVIIATTQTRSKDSYAASPTTGLVVRANGEESVCVIDARGNVWPGGIPSPSVSPTAADAGVSGTLPQNMWYGYVYTYASARFPFVQSDNPINGLLYPYSFPSSDVEAQVTFSGGGQITGTVTGTTNTIVTTIWLFRTAAFSTMVEAQTAAQAGTVFFQQQFNNPGTATTIDWTDNNVVDGTDQPDLDNYPAPQFQFVVYYDPYWYGFGNLPYTNNSAATWNNSGGGGSALITLSGTDTWFPGRNGQNITFAGITTGGIDGLGTFLFLWISSTTSTVTIDGHTPVALPSTGTGSIVIQGPATTLYRSKPRNPFAWGFTEVDGSINVPQQYAFKIGGGQGTAIAVVPNYAILKLDTEYPATCYTLNLQSQGTTSFESTLRLISTVYSVSAHFSQFWATAQDGSVVLWGMDYKNFAILQSDGITQKPISTPIPRFLRALSSNRQQQLLTHGVYDPRTELNCMWVPTALSGISLVNYLVYQHAPTGFWGFSNEQDILSSASIQDSATGTVKTFAGTQTGIVGQLFVEGVWNNWLPSTGTFCGTITSATGTAITVSTAAFNTTDNGIIGNWVLITDQNGQQEQYCRIVSVTATTLTFDYIRALIGGGTSAFNPIPSVGWFFYIGLIECRLLKYFDFSVPQTDKQLMEIWLTQQNVDTTLVGTLVRYYRERSNAYTQFELIEDQYADTTLSDEWFSDGAIPSELVKMFGLEIINRGYEQWTLVNLVLKPRLTP